MGAVADALVIAPRRMVRCRTGNVDDYERNGDGVSEGYHGLARPREPRIFGRGHELPVRTVFVRREFC